MEAIFENLKKHGKNSVDNLIKWLQDAKIVSKEKAAEDKVRKMFSDVKDQKDVPLDKFKQVLSAVASDQNKTAEDLHKQLTKEAPKNILSAATEAAASTAKAVGGALKNVLKH